MNNLRLNGFLGIEFGCSQQIAKEKLASKTESILDSENSDQDTLLYNGVKFAGRETELVLLLFFEGKFCKGVVFIKPKLESMIVETYRQIRDEINGKYYLSESDYETYISPYEENDGYTELAISLGKANFSCFWNFENPEGLDNYISLEINENLQIKIGYENGNLMDLLVKKNQERNSLDY